MKICFIDEAGDLGALGNPPRENDQPVLVITGLIVDQASLYDLTNDFLDIKRNYFPGLLYPSSRRLDRILPEIKGADVRRNVTRGTSAQQRHAIGFLDRVFELLDRHGVRLVARIWVKGIGVPFKGTAVYTSSVQEICAHFFRNLTETGDLGICIADSRNKHLNVNVAHSIFTQKFKSENRSYRRIAELPAFGHSDNHAGIQVCDIVCSGLLCPIACFAYCTGHVNNVHLQPSGENLRRRYGQQLKNLQYRYRDLTENRYRGGLAVSDRILRRNGSLMFS